MATNPTGSTPSLFERVKNILLQPKAEWPRIDSEPATVAGLFTSYAMILAAIGPVASVIGLTLAGVPIGYSLPMALVSYVVGLAVVFVTSLIIDALAPTFGGTKNQVQATKLAVYSSTPGWLVGVLALIPPLLPLMAVLGFLALIYGIYLLYLGLPLLMKVSEDKAVGYVAVVVVAWIIIYYVFIMLIAGIILSTLGFGMMAAGGLGRY